MYNFFLIKKTSEGFWQDGKKVLNFYPTLFSSVQFEEGLTTREFLTFIFQNYNEDLDNIFGLGFKSEIFKILFPKSLPEKLETDVELFFLEFSPLISVFNTSKKNFVNFGFNLSGVGNVSGREERLSLVFKNLSHYLDLPIKLNFESSFYIDRKKVDVVYTDILFSDLLIALYFEICFFDSSTKEQKLQELKVQLEDLMKNRYE